MIESYEQNKKILSCIASPNSKNIHCYKPKKIPKLKTLDQYARGVRAKNIFGLYDYNPDSKRAKKLGNSAAKIMEDAVIMDVNIAKDFNHYWFDKKTFKQVDSNVDNNHEKITADALGTRWRSGGGAFKPDIKELDRTGFCYRIIQNYNKPNDNRISKDCERRLNKKFPFIPFLS